MPELPEVETIIRALKPDLAGRIIISLRLLHPRVHRDTDPIRMCDNAKGAEIKDVYRRGKFIIFELSPGRTNLVAHLGMSGRLLTTDTPSDDKHLRALFELSGNIFLNFIDIRTFGKLFNLEGKIPPGFKNLGVEPLSSKFTSSRFSGMLAGRTTDIKTLLLRQDLIAGIGNIYASEALFISRIHPARAGEDLLTREICSLHKTIRKVLHNAIDQMGTTFSDYRKPDGSPGNFGNSLTVYGRDGSPCIRCKTNLERINQHGRSTFFCPQCQH
ncbi:MAG: bifunctional DNA-formamidopyrimidine glycosylase/DNA-(apurinic or apyrimidinic site) lyase [Candidatus Electryonea clarkiae]|nr:bifunctional DNA-formamidopyrimidine glycosylase/DNA-(apurinic or apyrimidinic site) lyase [Candidatus Electryonea clarkiae]MDP8286718.1 bifunctional DNA-formamidopyrimidine glycosylase/DNA-(apurinic or apyrimidinic site) lyase [Candidatus Electryonea clarkiae]